MDITEILKEFDDYSEPACMEKILTYLEEIKDEDYLFMDLLIEKFQNEEITWYQPWYQQTKSISRPLKEINYKSEEMYRTDSISSNENEKILKNWKQLIEKYDIPDKLISLARWRNKRIKLANTPEETTRRFVISYLARGLERNLYQIYRHIMTYYGGPRKGAYSEEEEKLMNVCFSHDPKNAVTLLSMVLGREPRGIYKRLQLLHHDKPDRKKIRWNLPLATKFVKRLIKYTGIPLEELKSKTIDREVWLKLGKKFDQNYIYLKQFWYYSLHVQLFVKKSVKMKKIQRKAYRLLKSSPYQVWSDIRWKEFVNQFPEGFTHLFLYHLCYRPVAKIPGYNKIPLSTLLDNAMENAEKTRKRRLKTLRLNENNQLEVAIYTKTNDCNTV